MRGWFILSVIALASATWANDGYSYIEGTGGRAAFVRGEHHSVVMVSETVCMDIYPKYYDVSATFEFHNTGKACMVTMGFPERNISREKDSGFTFFTTSVDRKPVQARRVLSNNPPTAWEDGEYSALWVKRVWFAEDQTRTVRVNYRSKPGARGTTATGDHNYIRYQFTGGNWRGAVKESRFIITWHIPGATSYALDLPDKTKITSRNQHDNHVTAIWQNWQAQGDAVIRYCTTDQGWLGILNNGRWGMGQPFTPDGDVVIPGRSAPVDWTPPAIVRNKVVFGNLRKFSYGKDEQISWDAERLEAKWAIGNHLLRFRLGRAEVEVDGKSQRLPASPFLSCADHYGQSTLFVPMQAILPYIGWKMTVDKGKHLIDFDVD
jgi:hypothetical protein